MTTALASENNDSLFDLAHAIRREGERIERLLQPILDKDYEYTLFKAHAQRIWVPLPQLLEWLRAYQKGGKQEVQPRTWSPLDTKSQEVVRERLTLLGDLADELDVTKKQIFALGPGHQYPYEKPR